MIDIRLVRAEPDRVAADLARRGVERRVVDELLELDAERRRLITRGDELRAEQKASGRAIGGAADASERERLIARTRLR
jgi:seryl-tRNA synthetase